MISLRPNMMWFWSLVFFAIVGVSLFSQRESEPAQSNWAEVEQLVRNGDVERIQVINRERAEVYLKEGVAERLKNDPTVSETLKKIPSRGMQVVYTIGSIDTFRSDLDKAVAESGNKVIVDYNHHEQNWMDMMLNWLPMIFMFVIFFFFIRSFRGGAGGAGGNIMNVGKARAQEFNQDDPARKVTFKD
ncbi:MAG: peptidase M41, partial [Alistipes sp.]|nr:peptidase M41 [Alistipes sp.]